jgi:hypothetical protein
MTKVDIKIFSKKIILALGVMICLSVDSIFSTHNTSRYFPFLERPEDYIIKERSHITPAFFVTRASSAHRGRGKECGIPELWGKYDLRDVITSLKKVKGDSFLNPIEVERGSEESWIDKSIRYKVSGKVKSRGLQVNYEQLLKWNFSFGAFIPLMYVYTHDKFTFYQEKSDGVIAQLRPGELAQLDRIRRSVNEALGLHGGDWTRTGFGDLDLHARYNYHWNYELVMRRIDLAVQFGTTVPTGRRYDINYPSSVPFMGDGHWSLYLDLVSEFELKQDWKFGLMLGGAYQFNETKKIRIPVYQEPATFSALKADVKVEPGMTFKISPYIYADNLTDGFNAHLRYTYLRHNRDKWVDTRHDPSVKSYLNQPVGAEFYGKPLTEEEISENKKRKKNLSLWDAHYLTFQLAYDTKEGGNKWILDPIIYAIADYNLNGNGFSKTLQVTFGIELHF